MGLRINDYFISKTKHILYDRNHYKAIRDDNTFITVEFFDYHSLAQQHHDKKALFQQYMHEYGIKSIEDNTLLISTLTEISKVIDINKDISYSYNQLSIPAYKFVDGIFPDLFPPFQTTIHVNDFKDNLLSLFSLFVCYRVIVWKENNVPQACVHYIKSTTFSHNLSLLEACWKYVDYISTMLLDDRVYVEFSIHNGILHEQTYTYSLMNALLYQLLLHIAAGENGIEGHSLAECAKCHDSFIKKHGNQRFCKKCSRNSERVKDYKARRKAARKEKSHDQ